MAKSLRPNFLLRAGGLSVFGIRDDWKNKVTTFSVANVKKQMPHITWGNIFDKDFDGFDYKNRKKHWHIIRMMGKRYDKMFIA